MSKMLYIYIYYIIIVQILSKTPISFKYPIILSKYKLSDSSNNFLRVSVLTSRCLNHLLRCLINWRQSIKTCCTVTRVLHCVQIGAGLFSIRWPCVNLVWPIRSLASMTSHLLLLFTDVVHFATVDLIWKSLFWDSFCHSRCQFVFKALSTAG